MTRTALVMALLVALLGVATGAQAQRRQHGGGHGHAAAGGDAAAPAGPAAPTPEQVAAARTAYTQGQTLFRAGQFPEALVQFNAAFAAVPNAVVLLSVAETQERLGQVPDAAATLEHYLQARPDAPDKTAVQARIDQMHTRPGIVAVTTSPAGAALAVDGASTGRTSPAELEVAPGDHGITASLEGHDDARQQVSVAFGARQELTLTLPESAPVANATTTTTTTDTTAATTVDQGGGSHGPPVAAWVFGGIGVAALIGGTVLGFLALSRQSDYDAHPTAALADEGGAFALGADICFGVAGAGLLTAIILLLTSGGGDSSAAPAPTARLQVLPTLGAHHAGLSASLQF